VGCERRKGRTTLSLNKSKRGGGKEKEEKVPSKSPNYLRTGEKTGKGRRRKRGGKS